MRIKNPILALAIPSVVSNITVPLLGLVDVAIVGHMGSPSYIGAIAIGGTIFSMVFWIFAFLRMGTTGIVSQAYGAKDERRIDDGLSMGLSLSLAISFLLIVLQTPLLYLAFCIMEPAPGVAVHATTYFRICIYGAPAMLANYCLVGWFVGCQNTVIPMQTAVLQNVSNIVLSLFFVYVLHWGVPGVALGTVLGQYIGTLYLLYSCRHRLPALRLGFGRGVGWMDFLRVNRDIFLRTLCLVAVTLFFTSAGSRMGEQTLETNALLMQLFILYSYFTDGLANAGEALCGRHHGAGDATALHSTIRSLFRWGVSLALLFTVAYVLLGGFFLSFLTTHQSILDAAAHYLPWLWAVPLLAIAAFVWDGVYIGLTYTRGMLLSMAAATATFFLLWFTLRTHGNHALWLAFDAYLFMRGAMQTILFPRRSAVK